jgi:transposase
MRSNVVMDSESRSIFVGVDVHLSSWHVTVRTGEEILFRATLGGSWGELEKVISRWRPEQVVILYEAGFSGFWLYDEVVKWGGTCIVVPPSRIPVESGNRIKTDRRDSAKLADMAARGSVPKVWVPTLSQRYDREVLRERRRLIRQARQVQCQIKALLHCYGLKVACRPGRWSEVFVSRLWELRFGDRFMQESFGRLLERYQFLRQQIVAQDKLIRDLACGEEYGEKVRWLTSLPGVGVLTAMELLVELGDITRFDRAEHVAAYIGLTPSEYSSGAQVRRGHISRCGKAAVRSRLVEASWVAIRFDRQLADVYHRIRARQGGKRAIVAVARRLLLRVRRLWLDGRCYQPATVA